MLPLVADHWPAVRTINAEEQAGFRLLGRHERIGRWHGQWRDTPLLKRRNAVVGIPNTVGA